MAKDAKPAEEGAAPPKKSKKLLIIILAVVLLVVLAGGAAAFLLLKKSNPAEGDDAAGESAKTEKKHEEPPVFVALDTFTVNLVPEVGDQYLQVVLSLELANAEAQTALTEQMPKIRNDITLLLSSKKASELLPKEGKEHLAGELKNTINGILESSSKKGKEGKEGALVKSVLFTSFIIQ